MLAAACKQHGEQVGLADGAGPAAVVPGLADDVLRAMEGIKLALKNAGVADAQMANVLRDIANNLNSTATAQAEVTHVSSRYGNYNVWKF